MNTNYTLNELLVVNLSKEFNNGEVGFTGLATGKRAALYITAIPLVAMELARRTHAPDLNIIFAGWIQNPDLSKFSHLPDAEYDETLRDIPCEGQYLTYPYPYSFRRGSISFGFGSGVQLDKQGNINSVCIGNHKKPKVRMVGPIFLPEHFSMFGREYVMMPHHERRTFINKVDYVSGVGYPGGLKGRKKLGLPRGGPELVITPKCIFEFNKNKGFIKVKSIHPGVSIKDLKDSTGFELGSLDNVKTTEIPNIHNLKIIREDIDPHGVLLGKK
tara:strand:- start:7196 stop:8014 length:819 start_codon:yes stop_codon:yes gene_type:complete